VTLDVEATINDTRLVLRQGDITVESTDAIVNAANPGLMGGGGVDGAIHRAGGPVILAECVRIIARQGRLPVGKAVVTSGGNLKARYVIHTVGPIWRGGHEREADLLASAYAESLKLAADHNVNTISFPSISTGAYGYPVAEAAMVALKTVISCLKQHAGPVHQVVFVLYSEPVFAAYRETLKMLLAQQE
jgi:O-acetyl-ADP-ribose deacetylase (regulator of RNase III)